MMDPTKPIGTTSIFLNDLIAHIRLPLKGPTRDGPYTTIKVTLYIHVANQQLSRSATVVRFIRFLHHRRTIKQTIDRRNRQRLLSSISVPTKRIVDKLAFLRQKLDLRHRYIRASDGVATGEVNRRTPDVVSPFDVTVLDVEDSNRRRLVTAVFGLAVVLIDDDAVEDILHLDVLE